MVTIAEALKTDRYAVEEMRRRAKELRQEAAQIDRDADRIEMIIELAPMFSPPASR